MLRFAQEWENMDGSQLVDLGLDPGIEWDPRIVDRLLEVGLGHNLYYAGEGWPDDRYDPRILDRLIEIGDGEDLFHVGRGWSDDRYDSRVAQALMDTKDMDWIKGILGYYSNEARWKLERIRDILMAWQGVGGIEDIGEDNA